MSQVEYNKLQQLGLTEILQTVFQPILKSQEDIKKKLALEYRPPIEPHKDHPEPNQYGDCFTEAGLVSENDYCKGKNDYSDGGIIYGLYLAPKVKYIIILNSDGILKEKKTFKGYSNDKIAVEDYIRLASGHEFKKPWEKSFTNGVVIPKDDDQQMKVFQKLSKSR
ncbi:hypothetical protein LOTGIDRAFT_172650 [Lottia gigantea]|uniref:Uncharacterized protein n=1 Tax=Lottia gigantea TaxID=225164 RepID=V4B201_LOTGI|nr:hypothetical protein LOTGIDRAFT_172650 [Lottia gigantea]ESP01481.1 hypothetical protein LOTGIDRAFT_172650 [Lottia gigantea]